MEELNVRMVHLEPLRVASVHGFGREPEGIAWQKLVEWAQPQGYLENLSEHRIFGFNNPSPAPGSPNYGYEFWMEVGDDVQDDGTVTVKQFGGGLYAVTRCKGVQTIEATWRRLTVWYENSAYEMGRHQWLEQHLGGDDVPMEELELDLFLPVIG